MFAFVQLWLYYLYTGHNAASVVIVYYTVDLLDVKRPEMVELLKQRLSQLKGRTEHDKEVK